MSVVDESPKLSKEEKKARKEEKRRRKAEKEAAASTSTSAPALTSAEDGRKEKKRKTVDDGAVAETSKKDKKTKHNGDAVAAGSHGGVAEPEKKKSKKDKVKAIDSTPAPTELMSAAGETPSISKKQQKKLAKTASSSSTPATPSTPQPFATDQQTYLTTHNITLSPHLYPPHLTLSNLPVQPSINTYLTTSKFTNPTPIQACSWPPLLSGRDVVGIAETGSGKTLAFGIPGLHLLANLPKSTGGGKKGKSTGSAKGQVKMLVLAPTRELAQQSFDTLLALGKGLGIGAVCLFGGVGKGEQYALLGDASVRVVVGTPGRTLDLANEGNLDLSSVSYLVLDEADRMLDQGFENDIRQIIGFCPAKEAGRQTVMFSATWPESVRRLASTFLRDPIRITVGSDELSANKRIEQVVEVLDNGFAKDARLLHHLKSYLKSNPSTPTSPTRILVFALYKNEAQRLEQTIRRSGYSISALHGDMSQDMRFKTLDQFKKGEVNVMVATDVAARGLDIPDVGLVINVTFPLTTEDFVHRCGRTGRAGKSGKAVTFFTGENHEKSLAGELMRVLRDAGAEIPKEMDRFPSTIKKKDHGSYGAFYKDISNAPAPTKITFD